MRVVSWNIHWGCGRDGRIRIHAIIDVLRKLNPDVICLQEVAANHPELEGSASASQFKQLAGAFGGYHMIEQAPSEIYRNNLPRQFGNILLSKYRITQAQRHMLPWPADARSPSGMPRGMIETVLEAPGGKLRVLTTHLEYYSPLQRRAQVPASASCTQEACARAAVYQPDRNSIRPSSSASARSSAIFCGDFNFTPGFRRLPRAAGAARSGRLSSWSTPGAPATATWRARRPPACTASSGRTSRNATTISL
jgi:endonuclease/exonuclease/phosphatase family metal-dependent hydrolase